MILTFWPCTEQTDEIRRRDHEHREEDQVIEHLVAHRLPEDVDGNRSHG